MEALRGDITFVPVRNGFICLVAIMEWATRKVLSWRLSTTMHADFCADALNKAIAKHGPPGIMNADQGKPVHGIGEDHDIDRSGFANLDGRRILDCLGRAKGSMRPKHDTP